MQSMVQHAPASAYSLPPHCQTWLPKYCSAGTPRTSRSTSGASVSCSSLPPRAQPGVSCSPMPPRAEASAANDAQAGTGAAACRPRWRAGRARARARA